jgi:uncharacterized protein (DUF2267 family)
MADVGKEPISRPKRRRSAGARTGARLGRSRSQKYVLLERVAELLELSRIDARTSMRTVLHSLRDRLPHDVLVAFGKKLPPLAFGIYFEGWQSSNMPLRTSLRQFVAEIQERLPRACVTEPISVIQAVLTAVGEHVGSTKIEEVKRALPQELHGLFDALPSEIRPCVEAQY